MPYTPPSHRSPAASTPASPDVSRRPSFHTQPSAQQAGRPTLPRSASYLTRHRRTPSAPTQPPATSGNADQPTPETTPETTSEDLKGMVSNSSLRQSPPPVTDDRRIPNGAILSPPVSPPESSDDDDLPEVRGRKLDSLKALHVAVSQISQHRESSPSKADPGDLHVPQSQSVSVAESLHHSFSTGSLDLMGSRRSSHVRSVTDPMVSHSAGNSLTGSEEDSDEDELRVKPQMVRKKSGELVRPALRPPSRRRPSSMPGTPTFSKAVHFDSHLEHVRHFLQVDRPLAVSAGSSPVDNYDSDNEFPFPNGDERGLSKSPPFEWEIIMTNFPVDTPARKAQAARLERVWLSNDQKCLIGSVAVANVAFQKYVTCRFTLDYWKTTSEIAAEYMSEIRPRETPNGHDRFNFTIKLSDLANLESKTLYFCVRYNVNGQDLWDNNNGTNFQVDFKKKFLPQNGKHGVIGAASRSVNGLPRSSRRASPSGAPRPKSMPVGMDDFAESAKINFDQTLHDYLGESGPTALRLKGVKSSANLPSDNLSSRLSAPSGQAFANRYDFGASLTAAVQAAKDATSPRPEAGQLYMKPHKKLPTTVAPSRVLAKDMGPTSAPATNNSLAPSASGLGSPGGTSISSSSYEEIVNKYCFFGSKAGLSRFDGADDIFGTSSSSSTNGSPLQMPLSQHLRDAQVRHMQPKDPNPYFQHAVLAMGSGSPAPSPIKNLVTAERTGSPTTNQSRSSSTSGQASGRPTSPASMGTGLAAFAGTSPDEISYQHLHDRFPFSGAETHAAAAIRG